MSGDGQPDIRECDPEQIALLLKQSSQPSFRLKQIQEWLWNKGCHSFEAMSNLPAATRDLLSRNYTIRPAIAETELTSKDGTHKYGYRLPDGNIVEGVLIPADDRTTGCISSQVGCPLGCRFCATGQFGFKRNLTSGEIFDQVHHLSQQSVRTTGKPLSNIVYMGMGEPFLNYEPVMRSILKITDPEGLGMSPQRITVSSVGIPEMIRRMAEEKTKCHLALSLHAATDAKRNRIIPINKRYPLKEVIESLKYYHQKTERRFTVEYILFRDFNDSRQDASDLAVFCRNFPVKVNLIEYNPVEELPYRKSDPERTRAFADFLEGLNMVVNIRKSRGTDIRAACGQLASTASVGPKTNQTSTE